MNRHSIRRVAVLMGGSGAEAEVSRSSAAEIADALRETWDEVELLEIGRELGSQLAKLNPDIVFPALHGPPGEDGTVQGLLEMGNWPYVGSGVEASAAGMNKFLAKQLFRHVGLPLAQDCLIASGSAPAAAIEQINRELGGERHVVKPLRQGSALGVTRTSNPNELHAAVQTALGFGDPVLVEDRIEGAEVTVGVLDEFGSDPTATPPILIKTPEDTWYDYHHRYAPGASEHVIPAPFEDAQLLQLQNIALRAHQILGCADLSRADFVVGTEGPVLLEVNTLPGMTPTSLFPDGAAAIGISFPELVRRLCESGFSRRSVAQ